MKLTALLVSLCLVLPAFSQERNRITGTISNAVTGIRIPNASVFINGTSRGSISKTDGSFELNDIPKGTYELVVSSVGYQTIVFPFSADSLPMMLHFRLEAKAEELEAVTVTPYEKNGWRKWGRVFTENFIGTSAAAKDCSIKNTKTLRFRYSASRKTLEVSADEPLIIENKALGYRIIYQLEGFVHSWKERSVVFVGYSLFEDMSDNKKGIPSKWLKRRKAAYTGSLMHFVRSLYNNRLAQDNFEVRRLVKVPNLEKQRVKKIYELEKKQQLKQGGRISFELKSAANKDSVGYFQGILMQEDSLAMISRTTLTADSILTTGADSTKTLFFPNYLQIISKGLPEEQEFLYHFRIFREPVWQRSLIMLTPLAPVVIEKSGLMFPPQNILSSEYWGWSEKISHMLPLDYQP